MKKILVTGGAGFIGSAVIRYLVTERQCEVINVDKLTYAANLSSLEAVKNSPLYHFYPVDIGDEQALWPLFEQHQPDGVMHLAAESHVDRSIDGPAEFVKTNLVGTYTLLEVARKYYQSLADTGQAGFRFHHISTDEVYGDLAQTAQPFNENNAYQPSSPYAATKAGADHLVRAWGRTFGLPVVVSNCSNNYGPYQFPEKLIPKTMINAILGKPIEIYGDGKQVRDWLYVEDHAEALVKVLLDGEPGQTYNIGGGSERTNLQVVETVCQQVVMQCEQNNIVLEHQPLSLITHVADRPGHDLRYAIDAGKIERDLGFTAKQSFDSGIAKTVAWYLKHQLWWKDIIKKDHQSLERIGLGGRK